MDGHEGYIYRTGSCVGTLGEQFNLSQGFQGFIGPPSNSDIQALRADSPEEKINKNGERKVPRSEKYMNVELINP